MDHPIIRSIMRGSILNFFYPTGPRNTDRPNYESCDKTVRVYKKLTFSKYSCGRGFWEAGNARIFSSLSSFKGHVHQPAEKFRDLGTVTRPPSSIYARVNCSIIRDWCTRVQGHISENCFDDHGFSGFRRKSTTPDHTTPVYSGIRRQTYLFKCSSETSQGHISETTRWIFFFKRWKFR